MKSSAFSAGAGILGCILIVACSQTREASAFNPPAGSYQVGSFELMESGNSQTIRGASVTPAFFEGAKVAPLLGRGFLAEEYNSSRQKVVMVSNRFWKRQFGGDW